MFGKVFASLWEGSMVGQSDVQLVFVYMLANCDRDGVVDKTHEFIAVVTGIALDRVRAAVVVLESPDPRSRTPDHEGRRILRLDDHRDWGWLIVNRQKYRAMIDEEVRREQNRERVRRSREHYRALPSVTVTLGNALCAQSETETENRESNTLSASADARRDWLEFFESNIWPHRPRKGAPGPYASESHKAAAARWAKIEPKTPENANRIADALETDVAAMRAEGREASRCPHLVTWLNQERWEDAS